MYKLKSKPEDFVVNEQIKLSLDESGDYAYFWLWKRDYTTMRAVERISGYLRCRVRDVGFAGNKDKHAVTRQVVSIKDPQKRVNDGRFAGLKSDDISLEYIGRGKKPVSLGDLDGNKFEIVLRDCEKSPEKISWFVNYFDEQRFSGTNRDAGKAIVLGDFKKACDLIDDERIDEYLAERPKDCVGAIKKVPLKTRLMFVHAYQSWLWNEAVSQYLRSLSDCAVLKYSLGELAFPREDVPQIGVPLVGFGTELGDAEIDRIVKGLIEKDGVSPYDFVIRAMPELSAEGGMREVVVTVSESSIENVGDGVYKIKFFLPKGCYATMCVKRMMV
jgi:tRNA pseudouridine13 synthase